jgi:site-specific recombinase XerD
VAIPKPSLEDQLRGAIRRKQYSRKTEDAYAMWYRQYVRFHARLSGQMRHPADLGAAEVSSFLTHLAQNRDVAASTQNQALNALVFLYSQVLKSPLVGIEAARAKVKRHLPVVLTVDEVKSLLAHVKGDAGLAVRLLYGCGLRVAEVLALHIKDVDMQGGKLEVRGGKGDKDRVISLPRSLLPALNDHQKRVRAVYEADCLSRLLRLLRPADFASLRLSRA